MTLEIISSGGKTDLEKERLNNCMFLSCHIRVSEWIYTLWLPEC